MKSLTPREKRIKYMNSKNYSTVSPSEREARLQSGIKALQDFANSLTPEARKFMLRGEADDCN